MQAIDLVLNLWSKQKGLDAFLIDVSLKIGAMNAPVVYSTFIACYRSSWVSLLYICIHAIASSDIPSLKKFTG
jgi:hypothetical protein